jgi:hypothetical protein
VHYRTLPRIILELVGRAEWGRKKKYFAISIPAATVYHTIFI